MGIQPASQASQASSVAGAWRARTDALTHALTHPAHPSTETASQPVQPVRPHLGFHLPLCCLRACCL